MTIRWSCSVLLFSDITTASPPRGGSSSSLVTLAAMSYERLMTDAPALPSTFPGPERGAPVARGGGWESWVVAAGGSGVGIEVGVDGVARDGRDPIVDPLNLEIRMPVAIEQQARDPRAALDEPLREPGTDEAARTRHENGAPVPEPAHAHTFHGASPEFQISFSARLSL